MDSEGVSLIGNGVDKTIIDGDVTFASNKSQIRGMTIKGNVTFEKNANNASLAFCKITGNLNVEANDFSLINCQVFGNVKINGNNAVVVGVGVGGKLTATKATTCASNYAFSDGNGDFIVAQTERGAALTCAGK